MTVNFGVRRLGHANVSVRDLDRSVAFFEKTCGFEEVGIEVGTGAGFVSNGNSHHDVGMVEIGRPFKGRDGEVIIEEGFEKPGLNHLGWEVDNEAALVAAIERAVAAGCKDYLTIDHTFSHSFYVADPDGVFHEFYADVMDDWRTVFSGGPIPNISARWDPAAETPSPEPRWQRAPEYQRVDGAPIHPLRTTRAVMVVDDVARSLDFYTAFAGLDVAYMAADGTYAYLRGGAATPDYHCALFASAGDLQNGCHHFSCEMADEAAVAQAEAALAERNIPTAASVDDSTKRSFYLRDPDGFLVEFYATRDCDFAAVATVPPERRPFHA